MAATTRNGFMVVLFLHHGNLVQNLASGVRESQYRCHRSISSKRVLNGLTSKRSRTVLHYSWLCNLALVELNESIKILSSQIH